MITEGSRPAPRRISKIIATTVDLPLVPVTAIVRWVRDEVGEQLRAMDDGQAELARVGDVGHLILDRGRDHERRAVGADAAAVLRVDRDAEPLELRARLARSPRSKARSLPLALPPVMAWNCASALMPQPPSPA